MKIFMILCLILCMASFADESQLHEIVGVTDFKPVDEPVAVWLNDEPIFHLYTVPSYPRISDSYPIKMGANSIRIMRLSDQGKLSEMGFKPYLFHSTGDQGTEVELTIDQGGSCLSGIFEAKKDYGIGNGRRAVLIKDGDDNLVREWVANYLRALIEKDKANFNALFANQNDAAEQHQNAELFFADDIRFERAKVDDEIICLKGKSLLYVCSSSRIAEWSDGKGVTRHLDGFLFAASDHGLLLRVSGGKWVQINVHDVSRRRSVR